jgi:hypothetical protein
MTAHHARWARALHTELAAVQHVREAAERDEGPVQGHRGRRECQDERADGDRVPRVVIQPPGPARPVYRRLLKPARIRVGLQGENAPCSIMSAYEV